MGYGIGDRRLHARFPSPHTRSPSPRARPPSPRPLPRRTDRSRKSSSASSTKLSEDVPYQNQLINVGTIRLLFPFATASVIVGDGTCTSHSNLLFAGGLFVLTSISRSVTSENMYELHVRMFRCGLEFLVVVFDMF